MLRLRNEALGAYEDGLMPNPGERTVRGYTGILNKRLILEIDACDFDAEIAILERTIDFTQSGSLGVNQDRAMVNV